MLSWIIEHHVRAVLLLAAATVIVLIMVAPSSEKSGIVQNPKSAPVLVQSVDGEALPRTTSGNELAAATPGTSSSNVPAAEATGKQVGIGQKPSIIHAATMTAAERSIMSANNTFRSCLLDEKLALRDCETRLPKNVHLGMYSSPNQVYELVISDGARMLRLIGGKLGMCRTIDVIAPNDCNAW